MSESRVIINTASQVLGRALVVIVSLLITSFLTHVLGASGYGNYVFISSLVLVFVGLSDLGTTTIGVREASCQKEKTETIFGNIFTLRLILSLFLFIIFNGLALFLPQFSSLRLPAFLGSLVIPFLVLRTTIQAILQSRLRLDLSSLTEVIGSLIILLFLLLFYLFHQAISLPLLMVFWAVSALLSGLFGLFFLYRYAKIKVLFDKKEIARIFKLAFPLGIYLLVYSVYDRGVDSFILKTFRTSSEVGYYGLAYKIYGNLILGAAFLMNSLFPLLANYNKDNRLLKVIYERAFTLLSLAGLLILIFGYFLSPFIINIIAGVAFAPSIIVLRILLLAALFSYLNHLTGYVMVVLNGQKSLLRFSLVGLFLNLILNLIFIPRFSILAASWITVLTELSLLILTIRFLKNSFSLAYTFESFMINLKKLLKIKQKFFEK